MSPRIVSLWFPHLMTDWMQRRQPELKEVSFALAAHEQNRRVIKAVNSLAYMNDVRNNMVVADARAILPELQVFDFDEEQPRKLLLALSEWCIRYTPSVSLDAPDGLFLDASGCAHLWGGEEAYVKDIRKKFNGFGYNVRISMAATHGAAWALCRFGKNETILQPGNESSALASLPSAALRIDAETSERLQKLGLRNIGSFIKMPRTALRRRFGQGLLSRLAQALGEEFEMHDPVKPIPPYIERLLSLEPIKTAVGIEIALKTVLDGLCARLNSEKKGLRKAEFKCHRLDGNVQTIEIGTSKPSRNAAHAFKLFENKISTIDPGLGIEVFSIEAMVVEDLQDEQEAMWNASSVNEQAVSELLDRLAGKTGGQAIHRYHPEEHYWPERAMKEVLTLQEKPLSSWRPDLPRPLHLLQVPELIEVSVPLPDYPPLLFIYKGTRHSVKKADGPERIEQEWWLQTGQYRDYYCVEDETGARYWLFRAGDYYRDDPKWFIHGFFS